jgi:dipeptide/tripeptide permease
MTAKIEDKSIELTVLSKTSKKDEKQEKFPKIIILFMIFVVFQVFSGGGFRSVLMIYMKNYIHLNDDTATAIYHAYSTISAFTPIIGAIIADAYLGPYRMVKYSIMITIIADIVLTITSIKPLTGSHGIGLGVALFLKTISAGGIGPCLGTLGNNYYI